jgi:DNA primase
MMTIFDLIGNDRIETKRVASTNGGEWCSPCPGCGGRDRFRIWPNQKDGRWWCRQCGKYGDLPGYLMTFHGMRYPQALEYLGLKNRQLPPIQRTIPEPSINKKWHQQAEIFINKIVGQTLEQGSDALEYLHKRGLSNKTIQLAQLGFTGPRDINLDRADWGLSKGITWVPKNSIAIPVRNGDFIARIKFRRLGDGIARNRRFISLTGSVGDTPLLLGDDTIYFIVEGEFDALLLYQEAQDLGISVVGLGSASNHPSGSALGRLITAQAIFLCLDFDEPGKKACHWWRESYNRAVDMYRYPPPVGKDLGESFQAGVNLHNWVRDVLNNELISEKCSYATNK